jgi:hypothetical protein
MTKNLGREDRGVRVVAAIALAVVAYYAGLSEIATIVVWVLAAYLLLTGLLGMCLFYKLIDVDTSVQEQPYSSTDDRAGL